MYLVIVVKGVAFGYNRCMEIPMSLVAGSLSGVGQHSPIAQRCLQQADVDLQAAAVSFAQFAQLQSSLWQALNDEGGGFLNRPMPIGSFSLLCHAIIGAQTLGEALGRLHRFMPVLADELNLDVKVQGDQAMLMINYDCQGDFDARFFIVSMATLWLRLSCWLVDRPLLVQRTEFAFKEPDFGNELPMIFATEVQYMRPANQLVFDREVLNLRIRQDQNSLTSFLRSAPMSLLTRYRRDESFSAKVRAAIRELVEQGDSLDTIHVDDISERLQTPAHTLRRRLRDEQTSFQSIRDSYRRSLAIKWLETGDFSLADIADRLGFSEPAAFTRAFKRWTGSAPGQYRLKTQTVE